MHSLGVSNPAATGSVVSIGANVSIVPIAAIASVVSIAANAFVVPITSSAFVASNGVSVVCEGFFNEILVVTGDFVKTAVKDDGLLLIVVWLAVGLLVVVLGKVDTGQLVETGPTEFI